MSNGEEGINWVDVARRNSDLGERLAQEGLTITYDEDGDTVFVAIGKGGEALTEYVFDNLYLRIDPGTLKLTGCVILAFEADLMDANKLIRKAFPNLMDELRSNGGHVSLSGRDAQKTKPYFDVALTRR